MPKSASAAARCLLAHAARASEPSEPTRDAPYATPSDAAYFAERRRRLRAAERRQPRRRAPRLIAPITTPRHAVVYYAICLPFLFVCRFTHFIFVCRLSMLQRAVDMRPRRRLRRAPSAVSKSAPPAGAPCAPPPSDAAAANS